MTSSDRLQKLCSEYQQAIAHLVSLPSPDTWKADDVLTLLTTRDRIQQIIDFIATQPATQDIPLVFWKKLTRADAEVRDTLLPLFATYEPIRTWQDNLKPSEQHWWWFPEPPKQQTKPYDLLWGSFTIVILTLCLVLTQDIVRRFTTGDPDLWSAFWSSIPIVLSVLAGGTTLTQVGRQSLMTLEAQLEKLLTHLKLPNHLLPEFKYSLASIVLTLIVLMRSLGVPYFADAYNKRGTTLYENGQWATAQTHFERSLSLTPDFPEAQFNLGVLYEEYQETDQAQEQYLKAVQAGYLPAYNNLARLYIDAEAYDEAAQLLRRALADPDLPTAQQQEPDLEYVLRKNLGWVRLEQGRLPEAETELVEAIRLNEELELLRPDAHCLLAQVLQTLDTMHSPEQRSESPPSQPIPASARDEWTTCLRYANRPEYDTWEGMARHALTQDPQTQSETAPNDN
jgi:tetratricopeptide (TPR) repeat protein